MKAKRIALLSFLAGACLIGGAIGLNQDAHTVNADTPVVWMQTGASLRVPLAETIDGADRDGIKFRAYYNLDFVNSLEGEKSVGMFIAPEFYSNAYLINEENCFGENAVYCWNGPEEGKKEIIHLTGYATKKSEDATVLTMDASIWNLKAKNLDKNFVGVAYLKAGDTYYFAETVNGVCPLNVAQKALLNENDRIYNIEDDADAPARVENAYITPYLGEGREYAYTENVYKQQKDGSYLYVESAEKTVNVTSFDTEATLETPANYVNYTAKSSSMLMNLVGDNTKDVYFNYAGNRVVIWDGDEHVADTSYMQRTAGQDLIEKNLGNGMYEGNYARILGVDGWDGPSWTGGFVLPAATDTLSVIVRVPNETFPQWQLYRDNAHTPKTYSVQNLEDGTTNEYTAPFDLAKGLYKITMTWADSFTVIKEFAFKAQVVVDWHLDNICAEIKSVGTTEVPHVFSGTLTFPAPAVIDTTVWDGETSDVSLAAKYKSNLDADYTDLVAENGVYTLVPGEGAYKYEIVIGETSYTTVNGVSLIDFSVPLAERDYFASLVSSKDGITDDYKDAEGVHVGIQVVEMGGKGALTTASAGWWIYAQKKASAVDKNFEQVAGFVPTKIGAWIYTTTDRNVDAWVYGKTAGSSATNPSSVAVSAGYSYVEFGCAKSLADAYAFGFGFGEPKTLYLFEIVLIP